MHIPDGFISPQTYLPAYAVSGLLWAVGVRRLRARLDVETLPRLAVTSAAAFVLMLVLIPLPGGTTAHATGIGMLAVLFGVWTTFLCLSLVFLLQAVMLGEGGVTSLPINALAMGLVGASVAIGVHRLLRSFSERIALFAAGFLGLNVAALCMALVLGIQPQIATAPDGSPRFFPFGLEVTIPAVMLPHLLVGVGEGLLTVLVVGLMRRRESV
ncbi:MAG: energy-coupling factor ABC transporter permease [bacterium]